MLVHVILSTAKIKIHELAQQGPGVKMRSTDIDATP